MSAKKDKERHFEGSQAVTVRPPDIRTSEEGYRVRKWTLCEQRREVEQGLYCV
jgi:hypothetical protein